MKKIMIIAGEASGDERAAGLIKAIKKIDKAVYFFGIGGEKMRAEGVEILVDSRSMAVVGLFEVIVHFPLIYKALLLMRRRLKLDKPDLLVLVDYPEFNLRLAKTAKSLGIKVFYFISPQIWAWRQERLYLIKKLVDHMAVILPFEVAFYEKAGIPATFVGHPLIEEIGSEFKITDAKSEFGFSSGEKLLGLFPGSRRSEIKRLLPVLLETANKLYAKDRNLRFILPLASTLEEEEIIKYTSAYDFEIKIVAGRSYDVIAACDAIICASGTVTLEIALMQTPLIIIYKVSPISYLALKRMIKIDHIALCNIVAGERIATEFIQNDAKPEKISQVTEKLLYDESINREMREKLGKVRKNLASTGASSNAARIVMDMLNGQ